MAKSRRILSVLLAILMVLTIVPMGLFSMAGAVSENQISTTANDLNQSFLESPSISISSTSIIRTAAAANSQEAGTTIVKATDSGLPELEGSEYEEEAYAGETPKDPMVVFTSDKELKANPTVTCSNAALTFTAAASGAYSESDGVYTYSWIVSGSNVTAEQLDFEVGYTYEYTDINGKVVTKTYTAYTTSAVENVSQPGGIYANRYRSYNATSHSVTCTNKERVVYIARIVGANTFGTYADNTTSGWSRGYYNFNTGSFTTISDLAEGYGQVSYSGNSGDGTQNTNTSNDYNRPVSTTYVDRSVVSLSNYNLRFTITECQHRTDTKYSDFGLKEFKIVDGATSFDGNTATNNASVEQLAPINPSSYNESTQQYDTVQGGTITIPFSGTTYEKSATTLDNGNKSVDYTIVFAFGDKYSHTSIARSAINLNIITYDKSNLRADVQDLYKAYTPTKLLASESEIGNSPNSWYYTAGWDQYLSAMKTAQFVLNDPDTDQTTIDAADEALKTAVAALEVASADYTEANVVKEEVKKLDSSLYTDESWSRVQTAVANITDGISIFCQTYLDSLVADLRTAVSELELSPADYSDVESMLEIYESLNPSDYTEASWKVLRDTVNSVDYTLTIDKQALVDAYARSIDSAITNLELAPADYTEVNAQVERYNAVLPNKDLYTDLSWRSVNAAYNAIEYDKNWKQQDDVDDMAVNLKNAINRLKYKDASYTDLEAAIEAASSEVKSWYTSDTWTPFEAALDAATEAYELYEEGNPVDILHQSDIDTLTNNLVTAQKNLLEADGDYTKVDEAIDAVNELDQSIYTDDSWEALDDAVNAVVYNLMAKDQDQIDGYATAINNAIKNLNKKDADYTDVNNIVSEWNLMDKTQYTDASILKVTNEINAINWNLKITDQSTVDGYVTKIRAAINSLDYKDADYTKVKTAENKANEAIKLQESFAAAHNGYLYYTQASYDALLATLNYTKDLDIRYQTTVDGYATAINSAYGKLQPNVADYSAVNTALSKIPADFDNDVYTDETAAEVIAAKLAITEGLLTKDQETVDGYAADLETAIGGLRYKLADYTQVELEKSLVPKDLTIYTKSSVENLNNVLNAVVYNLDINHQTEVDAYATSIKEAREKLEIDVADYTDVKNAITAAQEAIKDTNYTDASIQEVKDAIDKVVYDLPSAQQSTVNGYASDINKAVSLLTDKPLDLTTYNAVIEKVPDSLSNYTDASVSLYTDARNAADNFRLNSNSIRNQTEFEALVSALDAAIGGLKPKAADYTAVNTARAVADAKAESGDYTAESVNAYNKLIETINWNLTIFDQPTVDGYADAINAFEFTYKLADYTALEEALTRREAEIADGNYTDDSVAAFREMVNGFARDVIKPQQSVVDGYVSQINDYVFTYKPADYTTLDNLVSAVNDLDPSLYSNYDEIYDEYLFDYLLSYIPSHKDYNITEQSEVDSMVSTLQSYIDMLTLKPTEVAKFELKNGAKVKTSGGVNYIIGLRTGLTDSTLKSAYFDSENVTVSIKRVTGRNVGTGSTVTVISAIDGSTIAEYVILIYGDINGDGAITKVDVTTLANFINMTATLNASQKLAANLNGDRYTNLTDKTLLEKVLKGTFKIDQSTGKAV